MHSSANRAKHALLAFLGALFIHGCGKPVVSAAESDLSSGPAEPSMVTTVPASVRLPAGDKPGSLVQQLLNPEGFRVRPYGAFWADAIYETQRTSPGAFTLFVFSAEDQGEAAFELDARRTRLGLYVDGPQFGTAETGGRVEIDFQGNFVTENRAGVLLRHAYWEAKDDRTRLLVGQYWDVASPLLPSTLNYGYGYLGGNIGFRRTQIRAERFLTVSSTCKLILQGSLNQDIVPDFLTEPGIRREASSWPVVEGRVAMSIDRTPGATTVGLSGHIGETGFDFLTTGPPPLNLPPEDDARFTTWSMNIDVTAPITEQIGIRGEFFTGANLSNFLGGVGQGVCPCLRRPIRSTGGWGELAWKVSPNRRFHLGYGVDDPNNKDILFGRSSNQFLFVNVVQNITQRWITGIEVTYWRTNYLETRAGQIPADQLRATEPGKSVTIDWMIKYEF